MDSYIQPDKGISWICLEYEKVNFCIQRYSSVPLKPITSIKATPIQTYRWRFGLDLPHIMRKGRERGKKSRLVAERWRELEEEKNEWAEWGGKERVSGIKPWPKTESEGIPAPLKARESTLACLTWVKWNQLVGQPAPWLMDIILMC